MFFCNACHAHHCGGFTSIIMHKFTRDSVSALRQEDLLWGNETSARQMSRVQVLAKQAQSGEASKCDFVFNENESMQLADQLFEVIFHLKSSKLRKSDLEEIISVLENEKMEYSFLRSCDFITQLTSAVFSNIIEVGSYPLAAKLLLMLSSDPMNINMLHNSIKSFVYSLVEFDDYMVAVELGYESCSDVAFELIIRFFDHRRTTLLDYKVILNNIKKLYSYSEKTNNWKLLLDMISRKEYSTKVIDGLDIMDIANLSLKNSCFNYLLDAINNKKPVIRELIDFLVINFPKTRDYKQNSFYFAIMMNIEILTKYTFEEIPIKMKESMLHETRSPYLALLCSGQCDKFNNETNDLIIQLLSKWLKNETNGQICQRIKAKLSKIIAQPID